MSYEIPYITYTADGTTTEFSFSFEILQSQDIEAYKTLEGQKSDPDNDLVPSSEYTVSINSGTITGGEVTFSEAPESGSTITLIRAMEETLDSSFRDVETFSGGALDRIIHRTELLLQQNSFLSGERSLHYPINAPGLASGITEVEVLPEDHYWLRRNDKIIAVQREPGDQDTLRSELASAVQGADGARLIGFYNEVTGTSTTVQAMLGVSFQVGQIRETFNPVPAEGWIRWQDGTLGNSTSGATVALEEAANLYVLFWENIADEYCPVTGGRGNSAIEDFNAGKPIGMPLTDDRACTSVSDIHQLGQSFGEGVHILTANELPPVDVTGTFTGTGTGETSGSNGNIYEGPFSESGQISGASAGNSLNTPVGTPLTVATTVSGSISGTTAGQSFGHNNIPPSIAVFKHIKL